MTKIKLSIAMTVVFMVLSGDLVGSPKGGSVVRPTEAQSGYTDPEGRFQSSVNGPSGELINRADAAGLQTLAENDAAGNPLSWTLPSGAVYEQSFDSIGNRVSHRDVTLGGTTTYTYEDNYSQIIGLTDPFGNLDEAEYDASGNWTLISSSQGRSLTAEYNARGQLDRLTDSAGTTVVVEFEANGNPERTTVGQGEDARTTEFSHTPEGYLESILDAEGRLKSIDYDAMGRIVQTELPDGRTVALGYDSAGNRTSVTPPGREAFVFNYDQVGRLASESYPPVTGGGTNQTGYEYNSAGQLTRLIRPDSQVVTYEYDGAGRGLSIGLPSGDYDFTYDPISGLQDTLTSPHGITLDYDYTNEIITGVSWSGEVSGTVGYDYDEKGRLSELTVEGSAYSYTYSGDDDLVQAGEMTLSYDAATGLMTGASLGNVDEMYEHNNYGELRRHTVTVGAVTLYDVQYLRDKLGRITQIVESIEGSSETRDYTYDLAGRLETVVIDGAMLATYTYDSNGNRRIDGAVFDVQDRLTGQSGIAFAHNGHGERIEKTEGSLVTGYRYDAQGSLIGADLPNGDEVDYILDGHSRRVGKKINDAFVRGWLYADALNPVARLDALGDIDQRYVYAARPNTPAYVLEGSGIYFIVSDHLGSVRLVVDSSDGSLLQRIEYDAWGRVLTDTNPGFQPFGFGGGILDHDTNFTQFGQREYDATTARWTSKDPLGFLGRQTNFYEYAFSDPINLSDINGLEVGGDGGDPTITGTTVNVTSGLYAVSGTSELSGAAGAIIDISASGVSGAKAFSALIDANNSLRGTAAGRLNGKLLQSFTREVGNTGNVAQVTQWLQKNGNQEKWNAIKRKLNQLPPPRSCPK